jgi:ABC-2 type transport system ATP-binding protein
VEKVRDRGVTIVLVTHFMDEAERLCDRIAVIDRGRVIAVDTPEGLIRRVSDERRLRFRPTSGFDETVLTEVPEVAHVTRDGAHVVVSGTGNLLFAVVAALAAHEVVPADFRMDETNLEDAFVALTGRPYDLDNV